MNPRIAQIAVYIANQVQRLIAEAEDEIQNAINATVDSANDEEKEAILTLPVTAKWNMDKNDIAVSLTVAVKHKFTSEGTLADPNQPELPATGKGSVSLSNAMAILKAVRDDANVPFVKPDAA